MNLERAEKACSNAAGACVFLLVVFFFIITLAYAGVEVFAQWRDPVVLVDAVMLVIGIVGFLRHSRVLALLVVAYYLLDRAYILIETGSPAGLVPSVIILWFLVRGVVGVFSWHRRQKELDPTYRAAGRWGYWVGIPLAVVVTAMVSLGVLIELGLTPPIEVIDGTALSDSQRDYLVDAGIVSPEEKIELFYSTGLLSIEGEGNLLTDQRVISYETINGQLQVYGLPINEVVGIAVISPAESISDAIVEVSSASDSIVLWLSGEGGGDQRFLERLRARAPLMQEFGE